MNNMDTINGLFETGGGFFLLLTILETYRKKAVEGVSILHVGFFLTWGYWNLFFYPHVGCWWSFWGGVGLVTANTVWAIMFVYYKWFYVPADRRISSEPASD